MPNFKKFLKVFIREYKISREEALLSYTWDDIQDFVIGLPIERVITVYSGKDADNKGRFLAALCDKNEMAVKQIDKMAEDYEQRLEEIKKKKRSD